MPVYPGALPGDSVLFSDQADRAYKQGELPGFRMHETENAKIPLPPGPLYRFVRALEGLREKHPIDAPPFRIALVTARDIEFCERPIRTLSGWGIQLDHAAFCGDMSKAVVLEALKPLIFFDDSLKNCNDARSHAPTVMILAAEEGTAVALHSVSPPNSERPEKFRGVCKLYLRKDFDGHSETLMVWHDDNLTGLPDDVFDGFIGEVHRSAQGTPGGRQRRAAGAKNEDIAKFLLFLENALKKHSTSHRG